MTIPELLANWDNGDIHWSIEMGGIGPGYEQAIQVLIVELLRDHHEKPLPVGEDSEFTWGDNTVNRINRDCLGFSGAQVGAAKQVAYRIIRDGYDAVIADTRQRDNDRLIQVSNKWPHVSTPQAIPA